MKSIRDFPCWKSSGSKGSPNEDGSIIVRRYKASQALVYPIRDAILEAKKRQQRERTKAGRIIPLNIPLFTILAPHRRSLVPALQPTRPWWDFDPTLPEDAKRQMYFMEQVADEVMRRSGEGDSTWSSLDMMLDDAGI